MGLKELIKIIKLYKNGEWIIDFQDVGCMHSYVDNMRKMEPNAKYEGYVDGKLTYTYRTQNEIESDSKVEEKVKEEYAYIGFMVKVDSLQRFIDVLKEQFSMVITKDTIKGLKRINVKIDETKN